MRQVQVDNFLDLLADLVAERLAQRATAPVQEGIYSSFSLPPDCPSRDRFNKLVKRLPGATRAGRCWSVRREVWDEFRTKKPALTAKELAERSVRAAGYRRVA